MGIPEPKAVRRVCPEPDGHGPDQNPDRDSLRSPNICGRVHFSVISPTCPEHIRAAADAFWRVYDGGSTPDTTFRPPQPPAQPKRHRKQRKR